MQDSTHLGSKIQRNTSLAGVALAGAALVAWGIITGALWLPLLLLPFSVMMGLEMSVRRNREQQVAQAAVAPIPHKRTQQTAEVFDLAAARATRVVVRDDQPREELAPVVHVDFRRNAQPLRAIG
ncbi:hypothetical protein [Luteococcus sp. OSA5]|uniref:hypothetical protein n=1 Tax=Luteococcus sp. OSA5 TaxID=3401630 RepID=UPI003B42D1FB